MAPSNVFSYLRPHHRRAHSHPNSPEPPLSASSLQSPSHLSPHPDALSPTAVPPPPSNPHRFAQPDQSSSHSNSPLSPFPPVLPPIPRIASRSEPPDPQKQIPRKDRQPQSAAGGPGKELGRQPQQAARAGGGASGGGGDAGATHGGGSVSASVQVQPSPDAALPPERRGSNAPTGFRSKGQRVTSMPPPSHGGPLIDQVPSYPAFEGPTTLSHQTSGSPFMSQISLSSSGTSEKHSSSGKASGPPQHGKSSKRGLNLLNPMSLLLRRRSAQALQHLSEESLVTHRNNVVPAMPYGDDFDPSIRGSIVHDFSAPKPRRAQSYDVSNGFDRKRRQDDESPSKRDRSHTPVFKENFDDDTEADDEKRKSAIRAESLANHDFLARNAVPDSGQEPPAPPFARIPGGAPHIARKSIPPPLNQVPSREDSGPGLATVPEASPTSPTDSDSKRSSTAKTPPKSRSRATSNADSTFQCGLPAHMTSRASRFSFQIAGVDSAQQEKLLEEKHRQKVAARASEQPGSGHYYGDEEEDMYDYDNVDDDIFAGFEEEIPTIGGDYDDGFGYGYNNGYSNTGLSPALASFDFSTLNNRAALNGTLSPISATGESLATPRDPSGNVIGSAITDDHQQFARQPSPLGAAPANESAQSSPEALGLGLTEVDTANNGVSQTHFSPQASPDATQQPMPKEPLKQMILDDDDDLYFDDGLIGEPDPPDDGEKFDESVFDDPDHPLYERPAPAPKTVPGTMTSTGLGGNDESLDPEDEDSSRHGLAPHPSIRGLARPAQDGDPFQFRNPQDYFTALAEAAQKAEAEGRFVRKNSIATTHVSGQSKDEEDEQDGINRSTVRDSQETAPSLIPDSGRVSGATENLSEHALNSIGSLDPVFDDDPYGGGFGDGFDDYDSALEDDPIIAAANAEALANDFDGEYGTEFGFYANAAGGADAVYGGFFGPRGLDALGRSVSGRYAVREPNLTPITERSEYSTRNSFIGMGHFGNAPTSAGGPNQQNSAGAVPSPGLAQLARMSPYGFPDDDYSDYDISLEQLMKLRKGAFGGAGTASPGGSAGSSPRNSSPLSYFPGSFPGRGGSPVATRTKSALDTYSDLQEVQESPNEDPEEDSDEVQKSIEETPDEDDSLVQEANRADSASDLSSPVSTFSKHEEDENLPDSAAIPVQDDGLPHRINTNYENFLPDQPGNIPVSVPASAISTTSTSSIPMSHASASGIPPAPLLSPTSPQHQLQQPPFSPPLSESQKQSFPHDQQHSTDRSLPYHLLNTLTTTSGNNRDSAASIAILSPLSPTSPQSSSLADHPHRKSAGGAGRHSRTGSSGMADSVAYVKERIEPTFDGNDPDATPGRAEFRWVLERRRTSGTGEVEVVGREVVEGGRI